MDGSPAWVTLRMQAKNLNNVAGIFSKMNPYFSLSRSTGEMTNVVVYNSEVKAKTKQPNWDQFDISMQTLCNNDEYRPIRVELYHKKGMNKKCIGFSEFTINSIQNG